jgi:cysteine sulfinate desulfinase/cysteine desulfurase-like protein
LASPHPCYLDNSATTRPFDEVIDAMARAMAEAYYNPSAAYPAGVAVEDELNRVRGVLLAALRSRGRVVFTSGGTEADNLAILGTVRNARARFVTSAVEHPAAARAFEELRIERAKELLGRGDSSVKEVAAACGYESQSCFSRAFKRATGRPPRDSA